MEQNEAGAVPCAEVSSREPTCPSGKYRPTEVFKKGLLGLERYDAMLTAIAKCQEVDEIKIHDKAKALEYYAAEESAQDLPVPHHIVVAGPNDSPIRWCALSQKPRERAMFRDEGHVLS
jgi:hypothetical protein